MALCAYLYIRLNYRQAAFKYKDFRQLISCSKLKSRKSLYLKADNTILLYSETFLPIIYIMLSRHTTITFVRELFLPTLPLGNYAGHLLVSKKRATIIKVFYFKFYHKHKKPQLTTGVFDLLNLVNVLCVLSHNQQTLRLSRRHFQFSERLIVACF
jgi:hypothetical protein